MGRVPRIIASTVTAVSAEYRLHPHGYPVNNWPYAIPLILTGMLCLGLSLGLLIRARERQKLATAAKLAALAALPSPFARELGEKMMQADVDKSSERDKI